MKNLPQIEEIYHAALELRSSEREKFISQKCGDDAELRREVESLLSFEEKAESFIESPPEDLAEDFFANRSSQNIVGKTLNNYQILSLLGAGGMGEVYLAEDTKLGRKIAIKLLPEKFSTNKERNARFLREARAVSALNHPHILTIHEIGEFTTKNGKKLQYIAMEYIEGKTFDELIYSNETTTSELLKYLTQVGKGLSKAHELGIVHRDLKPENIMVTNDGYAKILDFGLAKLTDTEDEFHRNQQYKSTPGVILGTSGYMSPEQANGSLKIDDRSDIFAFGCILYEVLTKRKAFEGETTIDAIHKTIHSHPKPITEYIPNANVDLNYLVEKSIKKNPDDRYKKIDDIVSHLQTYSVENFDKNGLLFNSRESIEVENNLSEEINSLIGRMKEISEISEMLRKNSIRLVTLTGVGGTGKTRVAKSVADNLLIEFVDGVFFIDLSSIDDAELVIPFIAKSLGVESTEEESIKNELHRFLKTKEILLVLDNFEQIIDASPIVAELITQTEKLKIIVTSRVRLQLSIENEFVIEPLKVPDDKNLTADQIIRYPAVKLFVQRAVNIKPKFTFTEQNAFDIAEICRWLDGLPLAIELAAARIKLFAPKAILKRLNKSLKLLTGGVKDMPARQQTMQSAIAWSYDQLSSDEKNLLNRVSVFSGGFTIDAAESVCLSDEDFDILDGLSALIDNSLITQKEKPDGEPRFRLLKVIEEFAKEKLSESKELHEIEKRHAEYYLEKVQTDESKIDAEWFDEVESEIENYRVALEWSLENEPKVALKIVVSMYIFWAKRGYLLEGEKWTRSAIERNKELPDNRATLEAYNSLSRILIRIGDYDGAESFYKKAYYLSLEIGDELLSAISLNGLGRLKELRLDFLGANKLVEKSYKIIKRLGSKAQLYDATTSLANSLSLLNEQNNVDESAADVYYEKALKVAKEVGDKTNIQIAYINLAGSKLRLGENVVARSYTVKSLEIARELGDDIGIGYAFELFMVLAVEDKNFAKAIQINEIMHSLYENADYKLEEYQRRYLEENLEKAKAELTDEQTAKAENFGRSLSVDEAIALVLR